MTDLGRGVYVSHIDSDEFQPDPDDGGFVHILFEDGPTLDLKVGDMASMPAGAVLTWYPSADFKEVWIYS